jgi:hypothetical protein
MKGISTTLVIIVTAIVILVAALVVLTIFGGGITPIVDLTTQRNICLQQAASICQTTGKMPPTWDTTFQYREGDQVKTGSCEDLPGLTGCGCQDYKLTGCAWPVS